MQNLKDIDQAGYTAPVQVPDAAVTAVLQAIRSINMHDEADSYEWRGDGDYTPSPQEKVLLKDFGHGLISQLEDAIRALSAEPAQGEQWQPFETAPKDGTVIDLLGAHPEHEDCRVANCEYWDDGKWHDEYGFTLNEGWVITHWMPLPAAPTPEAGR